MERKFHAALTEKQRKTVQAALTLLEAGSDIEISEEEIAETLKAFSKPEGPEPRVEHIPVFPSHARESDIIGFGTIAGDTLFIQVSNVLLVNGVERLARIGDIVQLSLGLAFPVNPEFSAREA